MDVLHFKKLLVKSLRITKLLNSRLGEKKNQIAVARQQKIKVVYFNLVPFFL